MTGDKGLALATVLFMVFMINMSFLIAEQAWEVKIQRANEAELLWRGKKIQRAIERFYNERRMFPESIDQLYNLKYLRKPYKDPMVADGEWDYIRPPHSMNQFIGVKSKSEENSFYEFDGKTVYNLWEFKAEVDPRATRPRQVRPPRPR